MKEFSILVSFALLLENGVESFLNNKAIKNRQHAVAKSLPTSSVLNASGRESDEELFLSIIDRNERNDNTNVDVEPAGQDENIEPFRGAGVPRASLKPEEIAPLLMTALQQNDFPEENSGVTAMWEFSTDVNKFIFKNDINDFIESCHDTANDFPTSFYGVALNGKSWKMITELNRVGGENGWIATQIMETVSSDGRLRRWQWEFRKNKRPPCLGCWKVELIGSSDRQGNFQTEGRGTGFED